MEICSRPLPVENVKSLIIQLNLILNETLRILTLFLTIMCKLINLCRSGVLWTLKSAGIVQAT